MDTLPVTRTNRPRRATQNISLSVDEQRMARELAERHHGGNVSHLFRRLLRLAWAMEEQRDGGKQVA